MSKKQDSKAVKSLVELREELALAKRSHRMGELQNTARVSQLRKEIARALTASRVDNKAEEGTKEEEK